MTQREGEGTEIPLLQDEDVEQEEQVVVLEATPEELSRQVLVLRERMAELTEEVAEVYRMGMIIAIPAAIGTVGAITFAKPLLVYVFRQDEAIASASAEFILPYGLLTLAAIFPRIGAEQMMFAFGRTVPAMVIGLSNFVVSMGIGTSLAFGHFGLPRLGLTGVLIGCVADSYLTAGGFSLYIAKHPDFKDYAFFNLCRPLRPYLAQLKSILRIGLSFLFTISTELAVTLGTTMIAGVVGPEAQAALSGAMQYTLFTFLLQAAFGQSTAQEMSRALGEGHYRRVQSFGRHSLLTTSIYIVPIPLLFAAYPDLLIRLLNENNPTVQGMLRTSLPWLALAAAADNLRYNMLQQVRVLGDHNYAAALSSTAFLILGVIVSGLLGIYTALGFNGVIAGLNFGMLSGTIALSYHWLTKNQPSAMQQAEVEARLPAEPSRSSIWTSLSSFFSSPREQNDVSLTNAPSPWTSLSSFFSSPQEQNDVSLIDPLDDVPVLT